MTWDIPLIVGALLLGLATIYLASNMFRRGMRARYITLSGIFEFGAKLLLIAIVLTLLAWSNDKLTLNYVADVIVDVVALLLIGGAFLYLAGFAFGRWQRGKTEGLLKQ
ncbi:MAG: hypothetical protein H6918_02665 [Sphingomonadaceae bacterium]|nr:hypothetical protein [Sphingomonadaceae bacterium]